MKKMILMSTLLLMTCLVQAQILNVSPTLKKGNVMTYKSTTNVKASGTDVTVTENSKYTVTEETKDGFVIDMISSDWNVNSDNMVSHLLVAATEMVLGLFVKPIIILNTDHYYDPLLEMLDCTANRHFMNPVFKKLWAVADTPEEAMKLVDSLSDWTDTTSKINTNR